MSHIASIIPQFENRDFFTLLAALCQMNVFWVSDIPKDTQKALLDHIVTNAYMYTKQDLAESVYLLGKFGFNIRTAEESIVNTLLNNAHTVLSTPYNAKNNQYGEHIVQTVNGLANMKVSWEILPHKTQNFLLHFIENEMGTHLTLEQQANVIHS